MNKAAGLFPVIFLAVWIFSSPAAGQAFPGNFNDDYRIDLDDLMLFTGQWLAPPGSPADLIGNDGVNLRDYSLLAQNWLLEFPLVINEFMASNHTAFPDGNGNYSDWIEIYNQRDEPVNLAGWSLLDDGHSWPFPSGCILDGHAYLVIFASGQDDSAYPYQDPAGYYHTHFKLDAEGEYLALANPSGSAIIDAYSPAFPVQQEDISYGLASKIEDSVTWLATGDSVRYLVPANNSLGTAWTAAYFDDQSWNTGMTGIGYETAPEDFADLIVTDVYDSMYNQRTSLYMRKTFTLEDFTQVQSLLLRMKYDDGFVAYLNGTEVARAYVNVAEGVTPDYDAAGINHYDWDAVIFEDFDLSSYISLLHAGTNVLAIHGLNSSTTSSDFLLIPELQAQIQSTLDKARRMYLVSPTPGGRNAAGCIGPAWNPAFSPASTVFTDSLSIELSVGSPAAVIHYTLDGTEPTESSPVYSNPIPITSSTVIKAASYQTNLGRSQTVTQGYIRLGTDVTSFHSNLPLVLLENFGAGDVPVDPYQPVLLAMYDPVDGQSTLANSADIITRAGITLRGSSTLYQAKSHYRVETWQDTADEDKNIAPFGMPEESDWVLYAPFEFDRALVNNAFMYELSNQIGRYAVRTRFVEVFVNKNGGSLSQEDYVGVYIFMENVKRGNDRVDVEKLSPEDTSEPNISGGYMLKFDRVDDGDVGFHTSRGTPSRYSLCYVYPKEVEILNTPQETWIRNYLEDFEDALYGSNFTDPDIGYPHYIDVDSFVDHFWLNQLAKNPDALHLSTFLFKKRGGKLEMGPIWDFDRCLGGHDLRYIEPCEWTHMEINYFEYDWWARFFADPDFWQKCIDRWQELRQDPFSTANLSSIINSMANELTESQARNFTRWSTYLPGFPPAWPDWQGEIDHMKQWLADRGGWIDNQFLPMPSFNQEGGQIPAGFELIMTVPTPQQTSGLQFDGSGDYVNINGYQGILAAQARTLSAWIKTSTTGTILSWGTEGTAGQKWEFGIQSSVGYAGTLFVNVGTGYIASSTDLRDGQWHHVAASLANDGSPNVSEVKLYVDGVKESNSALYMMAVNTLAGAEVAIGAAPDRSRGFNGAMKEVRIYNRALSAAEILALAENTNPAANGLVAFWRLDDGSGTTAHDSAGSHDGALTGNPQWLSGGTIYYTLDGTDPRLPGGAVSPTAYSYTLTGPVTLPQTTRVRARLRAANQWSGQNEKYFIVNPTVVINEFLADNKTTIEDPDEPGEYPDWLELYNTGSTRLDLGGMYLTDDLHDPDKWRIPDGISIEPYGYVVFWADEDPWQGSFHADFKLSKTGESIGLFETDGQTLIDAIPFSSQATDISFGRYPDGSDNWTAFTNPSPGQQNQ